MPTYPSVRTGPGYGPRVEWENWVLLAALQASQGLLGPLVRAVAVEATPDRVVVHVAAREKTTLLMEDLGDLISDLEAGLSYAEPRPDVELRVEVGPAGPEWSGHPHPRLFMCSIWSDPTTT